MPFREKIVNQHAALCLARHHKQKTRPRRSAPGLHLFSSAEEVDESQYVEHYAGEGEEVPYHVGELESS